MSLITKDNTEFTFSKKRKDIEYINISSSNDLKIFFMNKEAIIAGFDSIDMISFRVQILFSSYDVKRLFISDIGFMPTEYKASIYSFKEQSFNFINIKFRYFILRLLSFFGLIKNVEFFFESSQVRINQINNSFSKKLKKKLGVDICFYKRIFRINSKNFDQLKNKKTKNNYIIYCDSGFDHPDRLYRENNPRKEFREKYYLYLYNLLDKIGKLYNKKIIFAQHPKNPYPEKGNFLKIKKNFKIINGSAEKYLNDCHVAIFHVSTLIARAMQLNKRVILINSYLLGNYLNLKNISWIKNTKLHNIKLSKNYNFNKKKLENLLNKNILNYSKFLKKNSYTDQTKSRSDQIMNILKINFFKN